MAYWFDYSWKYNGTRQVKFFLVSDEDVSLLPTSASNGVEQDGDSYVHLKVDKGSSAYSVVSGKTFILDSTDNWQEVGAWPSDDDYDDGGDGGDDSGDGGDDSGDGGDG